MIGTLLYYALYPLSRYVTSRHSEASKKGLPPAVVNDTAVWDGGAVTTRSFTQSQKPQLDQWLSPSSETMGETKERMKEPNTEKEDDTRPDREQLMAILHEETQNEAASKGSEVKSAEMRNGQQQDKVEAPREEVGEIIIHHEVLHMKEGSSPTEEVISPEQALWEQVECLQMEEKSQETTSPVQEQIKIPSIKESTTPAEPITQDATTLVQEQRKMLSIKESVTPAEPDLLETIHFVQEQIMIPSVEETLSEVTECWDEYDMAGETHGEESSCKPVFSTETHFKLGGQHDTQTGWHFPVGPGLAEEVQCPLWQFPAPTYYPPVESTVPFDVTWRVWENIDVSAAEPFPFTTASMDLTIMSYNILAQDLLEVNQQLYTHCPLEVLDWNYRCSILLEEIQKWKPDILCLQEVQENHYHEQLHPVLSQMGYTCVYKRRTGTKTDGCATCYRSSCLSEMSVTTLEYFRPETDLLDRHNVGIVLLLRPVVIKGSEVKAKGLPLCVANTHLLFNPKRGDVKLAQLAIMLAEIDSVVKSCRANGEPCNLIMCGDFNSVPHMPLYELITTGELYYKGLPAWMISGQQDLSHKGYDHRLFPRLWPSSLGITDRCQYDTAEGISKSQSQKSGNRQYSHDFMQQLRFCPAACIRPLDLEMIPGVTDNTPDASRGYPPSDWTRDTISHRLDLESVYTHVLPGFGNPEVTTLHAEGGATVDYIFYTPRRILTQDQNDADFVSAGLKLTGSLSLLSEDVLWSMTGLPNHVFPSDHLSLLAKFQLDLNVA